MIFLPITLDLVTSVSTAAIAIYAFAGVCLLVVRIRRREGRDYSTASALAFMLAIYGTTTLLTSQNATTDEALANARWVTGALIGVFVLTVHLALVYAGLRRVVWVWTAYGVGLGLELLNSRGLMQDAALARSWFEGAPQFDWSRYDAPLSWLGIGVLVLGLSACITALAALSSAYRSGKRRSLGLLVGVAVTTATLLSDLAVACSHLAAHLWLPIGYLATVFGVADTLTSQYASVHRALTKRTSELRTRTRELGRSYEELRAAQEELVRKEQLAVVGELAAVIAHEVRNPLAIIANAVAGLRKPTLSRDDHTTLLAILDEETSRLNRLVSDLLRYARPVNIQRTNMSLRDLLGRALQLTQNRKGLTIEFKVDAPETRLWGDSNLLRQVFDNLIDNAVQAMGYGGTLTVRIRSMEDAGTDGLAVDIIDTGEGMDTIVRSRARDPFFTTRPSGTGLGLAIVDRIVDAHGGRFIIESRTGEGTTATVFLPCGSPSEPPPRPRTPKRSPSEGVGAPPTAKEPLDEGDPSQA